MKKLKYFFSLFGNLYTYLIIILFFTPSNSLQNLQKFYCKKKKKCKLTCNSIDPTCFKTKEEVDRCKMVTFYEDDAKMKENDCVFFTTVVKY